MTATWLGLLPTMAARGWLAQWADSGWADRPEPDPEAYAQARRPGDAPA